MSAHTKIPEMLGALTGFSLLGADAAASANPIVPTAATHTTGHMWIDVAMLALRAVGVLGAAIAPVVIGKWIDARNERKKGKRS